MAVVAIIPLVFETTKSMSDGGVFKFDIFDKYNEDDMYLPFFNCFNKTVENRSDIQYSFYTIKEDLLIHNYIHFLMSIGMYTKTRVVATTRTALHF